MSLFGTDGIRGSVDEDTMDDEAALTALKENRSISQPILRLLGEALGSLLEEGDEVVLGWDDRPGNDALVRGLTQGLHLRGITVTWVGEVATPGLNACLLSRRAAAGCMITASHNPANDSGVKVFDRDGYKSMPGFETELSSIMIALATEEREVDEPELERLSTPDEIIDGGKVHRDLLTIRMGWFEELFGTLRVNSEVFSSPMLIDCSGGPSRDWLAGWLTAQGLEVEALVNPDLINLGCGAGGLSPTDSWSFDDLIEGDNGHGALDWIGAVITAGQPDDWQPGTLVAACLDGDGDRMLAFEIDEMAQGVIIVDGDRISDDLMVAARASGRSGGWRLATSIEADLGLISSAVQRGEDVVVTAVGDRWLGRALSAESDQSGGMIHSTSQPLRLGSEDSGHIVLPTPHPVLAGHWTLVGDGIATLVALLCARSTIGRQSTGFISGWKRRQSIEGSDRSLWTGSNRLSDAVVDLVSNRIESWGEVVGLVRKEVEGEADLLMIEIEVDGEVLALGIRNSGTQEKTNITLRLPPRLTHLSGSANKLVDELAELLIDALVR